MRDKSFPCEKNPRLAGVLSEAIPRLSFDDALRATPPHSQRRQHHPSRNAGNKKMGCADRHNPFDGYLYKLLLQLLDVDSNLNNSGLLDNLGETAQYRLHH